MKLLNLKCPNCGASLDIYNNIETFYCPNCASKLILEGQSKDTLDAKVQIHVIDKEYETKQRELELKHLEELYREKLAAENKRRSQILDIIGWMIPIGLLVFIYYVLNSGFLSFRNIFRMWFGF